MPGMKPGSISISERPSMSKGTCPCDSFGGWPGPAPGPEVGRFPEGPSVWYYPSTTKQVAGGSGSAGERGWLLRPDGIHMPRPVRLCQNDLARPGRLRLLTPELAPALPETAQTFRASSKRARGILACTGRGIWIPSGRSNHPCLADTLLPPAAVTHRKKIIRPFCMFTLNTSI